MLKKEFKYNIKTLFIWLVIIVAFLGIIFLVYPSVIKDNQSMMDIMNQMFSPEMLKMFNMDIISLDSVFGWIATEGYIFLMLISGSYFALLGGTVLLKEQSEHTINFLYSKPISKNRILTSKMLLGLIYTIIFCGIIALTMLIGLHYSGDLDYTKWSLISLTPVFISVLFYAISMLVSLGFKKTSTSIGVNLGIVFGFYILSILSTLSDKIEFLKYLSPFYYMDARDILVDSKISTFNISVMLISTVVFVVSTYIIYNKKELGK